MIDTRRNRFAHVLRGSETPLNRRQLVEKTWNVKIPQQLGHQTNAQTNRLSRLKRAATGHKEECGGCRIKRNLVLNETAAEKCE